MYEYSEARHHCPFVSFLFAHLGALGSCSSCPEVGSLVSESSALGLVLADLSPLLRQSLDWFKSMRAMSMEVRSSELDKGLWSSDKAIEVDTAISASPSLNPSSASPTVAKEVVETTASTPAASIEEITPCPKRACGSDKGKSKVDSSIWDDAATAMGRAHNIVTPEELKALNFAPFHELVSHHIHKLIQVLGEAIHLTTEYLTSEEKVDMANSKVNALEAEGSTLRKELIATMDGGNQMKEKIKALTDELKADKLLTEQKDEQLQAVKREASKAGDEARYLAKHNPGMDLDNLDLEVVKKEMEAEEDAAGDTANERAGAGGDD
ncbi:hypothetical protein SO802_023873 [Lithocarpus litseifolius]|uniref:Uncharacterized protein n=1 Tax=Lithocarpus litseifolius TaxID=425828 RepID=A0AAW2CCS3_9ROSI